MNNKQTPLNNHFSWKILLIILAITTSLLHGCKQHNRWDIDVSDIKSDIKIERFDKDFNSLTPNENIGQQLQQLQLKYGQFYTDYIEQIINAGSTSDTNYYQNIKKILRGKPYQQVRDEVQKVYPTINQQQTDLNDAFKHLKYYYPHIQLPRVISYFSGFEVQLPIGDNYIGIGLDLFLGANNNYYKALTTQIPLYISKRFTPENIVPRVIEAFAREDLYPERDEDRTLLSKMIYHGKIMVLLDAILPNTPDTLKIGYTQQQLKWCEQHENEIWGYFISENLLFESDWLKIEKFINEAPFTPGLGEKKESAPKLARWIGWQIARKYIQEHPQLTLPQLMNTLDAQKILTEAHYKPK